MTREQLEHAIRAAGAISGDTELYILGSQAILGAHPDAHPDLLRSMELDVAPKNKPELEAVIEGSIGELSPFHQTFGFYVDGMELSGVVLPRGWAERVVVVDTPIRGLCLEAGDLAVSKLAAGRDKDLAYVRVLLRERLVTAEVLQARIDDVSGLDESERGRLHERFSRLARDPSMTPQAEIEREQSTATGGGDRSYVEHPDGTRERVLP